jgi:hypothetical protein
MMSRLILWPAGGTSEGEKPISVMIIKKIKISYVKNFRN